MTLQKVRSIFAVRREAAAIADALPEAIDLWVLVLQAGLDFGTALQEYLSRAPKGALHEELATLLAEIQSGVPRLEALRRLRSRVSEPGLRETVQSILQGLELGSSLAPILKSQARALRRQRTYQAERRAAVAPLKLLFPLFVFIFPTLFVVLFGPVALTMMNSGGLP